jgi:hypothetical protein
VSDDLYPSGPWIGFYSYSAAGRRHRMDLHLTFALGKMTGDGSDDVGPFRIQGTYDTTNHECNWIKQYIGRHSVSYRGFREGKGIWGTWQLSRVRGGFHIWPLNSSSAEEMAESNENLEPLTVGIGRNDSEI